MTGGLEKAASVATWIGLADGHLESAVSAGFVMKQVLPREWMSACEWASSHMNDCVN